MTRIYLIHTRTQVIKAYRNKETALRRLVEMRKISDHEINLTEVELIE